MYGIPLPEQVITPEPKTYGYHKDTAGAYAVNSPAGAIGAWVHLIAGASAGSGDGGAGAVRKYVEIPNGVPLTFAGTVGSSNANTTMTAPVSMTASATGTSSGGDINDNSGSGQSFDVGSQIDTPRFHIGLAGWRATPSGWQKPGAVLIIWNY